MNRGVRQTMDSIRGAIVALTSSILVALLFAYTLAVAWLFYGLFGSFMILPVFGAIAGHLASQKCSAARNKNKMAVL